MTGAVTDSSTDHKHFSVTQSGPSREYSLADLSEQTHIKSLIKRLQTWQTKWLSVIADRQELVARGFPPISARKCESRTGCMSVCLRRLRRTLWTSRISDLFCQIAHISVFQAARCK